MDVSFPTSKRRRFSVYQNATFIWAKFHSRGFARGIIVILLKRMEWGNGDFVMTSFIYRGALIYSGRGLSMVYSPIVEAVEISRFPHRFDFPPILFKVLRNIDHHKIP